MKRTIIPSMLVAPPSLLSSPFSGSVIIMAGHQKNGSLGFILNQPINQLTISDLLDESEKQEMINTEKPVFFGGPVEKNSGFVLYEHKNKKPLAPGFRLAKGISISPSLKLLEDGAKGNLPGRFELLLGYSLWSQGQLNKELSLGNWLHLPFCPKILFDVPPEDRWQKCFDNLGIQPYAFINVPGGAQA